LRYAVISYNANATPYPVDTHASGSLKGADHNIVGRQAECGILVAVDRWSRCIALHLYDGLLTFLPIISGYKPPSLAGAVKGSSATARSGANSGNSILGEPFHARIEERTVLAVTFLQTTNEAMPHICLLHQDARSAQHVTTHVVDISRKQLILHGNHSAAHWGEWLKKSRVDGGSSALIPIPPRVHIAAAAKTTETSATNNKTTSGGVIVLGQRQITYVSVATTKVAPIPPCLMLTWTEIPADASGQFRYLLGDEFGNLHMLTLLQSGERVHGIQLDTLGSCTLSSSLSYLAEGLVFVGSTMGDSQLVQIHEEPMVVGSDDDIDGDNILADTTFLSFVEEYTNLGPILDFDLVPTTPGNLDLTASSQVVQSQVVTCSGSSRFGTLRLIRNGIGMKEYASVEIPGIQNMWSVRKSFSSKDDSFLVQSFVGETRVLGVSASVDEEEDAMQQEEGGTLAEVELPGLESMTSTLYVCNVHTYDSLIQVTESGLRLIDMQHGVTLDTWSPSSEDLADHDGHAITVATANESGQIIVALRGGLVAYFQVADSGKLQLIGKRQMEREVSSLDVRPFTAGSKNDNSGNAMETDLDGKGRPTDSSTLLAVGLWDDFTVRMLSLSPTMDEILQINLSTEEDGEEAEESSGPQRRTRNNMMARSLCLITLDYSSTSTSGISGGVDMLFVGLGDGTLISFAVTTQDDIVSVQARKEVSLGTQRINLIPLRTEYGGTCVLATGDRPAVIYLTGVAGTSGSHFNPKLCYSSVNLAAAEEEEGDDINRLPAQQSIAFNVAAPFFSPVLFDAGSHGSKHYSLCIADDSKLRLGVVDDIQKLHITTCRLGMTPRRISYCADGRLFAVGCIESGINQGGSLGEEANMGNCIRFLDDTTFDDVGDR
jgi:DNA damage-binding protein 1